MKEENKLAITGYNEEKNILTSTLCTLGSSNAYIATRSSIENRLREIDKKIELLTK